MRWFALLSVASAGLVALGCGKSSLDTVARPPDYVSTRSEPLPEGLFGPNEVSEEQIQQMLDYRLALPPLARVALFELRPAGASYWQASVADSMVGVLRQSKRVFDASALPALLFPSRISLGSLRAAAARFQADLLLLYEVRMWQVEKRRILGKDEVKSLCNVEALVLDTRSGLVIFTGSATRDFTARQTSEELSFEETRRQAQDQALRQALAEVGWGLVSFLDSGALAAARP